MIHSQVECEQSSKHHTLPWHCLRLPHEVHAYYIIRTLYARLAAGTVEHAGTAPSNPHTRTAFGAFTLCKGSPFHQMFALPSLMVSTPSGIAYR
jgi:hypothetical protein